MNSGIHESRFRRVIIPIPCAILEFMNAFESDLQRSKIACAL